MRKMIIPFLFVGSLAFSAGAQEGAAPAAPADHSHGGAAAASAPDKAADSGGMDMDHMHQMMESCMSEKKDRKICREHTMKECESNMKKSECRKMMKKMKKSKS